MDSISKDMCIGDFYEIATGYKIHTIAKSKETDATSGTDIVFKPIQYGNFLGCSWLGGDQESPFPKNFHTYPTMIKHETFIF